MALANCPQRGMEPPEELRVRLEEFLVGVKQASQQLDAYIQEVLAKSNETAIPYTNPAQKVR